MPWLAWQIRMELSHAGNEAVDSDNYNYHLLSHLASICYKDDLIQPSQQLNMLNNFIRILQKMKLNLSSVK